MSSDDKGYAEKWYIPRFDSDALKYGPTKTAASAKTSGPRIAGEIRGKEGEADNRPPYYDLTDAYANLQGATISILPTIAPDKAVLFKAYITAFNESYSSDWASEAVFGRTDPIYMFKQTTRSVTLAFKVVGASEGEAYANLGRIQELIHALYPAYTDVGNASTIAQSPLCRVSVLNLTPKITHRSMGQTRPFGSYERALLGTPSNGVLSVIKSVSLAHNIENIEGGVYQEHQGAFLPRFIEVSMEFDVLHEKTMGWQNSGDGMSFSSKRAPYGIDVKNSGAQQGNIATELAGDPGLSVAAASKFGGYQSFPSPWSPDPQKDPSLYAPDTETARAARAESENDALRANAEARYGGLFGGLIARRDENQIASRSRATRLSGRSARALERSVGAGARREGRLVGRSARLDAAAADEMERLEYLDQLGEFIDG